MGIIPVLEPLIVPARAPVIVPACDPEIVPARDPLMVPVREPVVLEPGMVPASEIVANTRIRSVAKEVF